jgi:peptidoglycan hydrolase-like protein with peptidoglycan-binding domain
MATQAELDRAMEWAKAQVGKTYSLGTFGNTFDCSTFMSGIATMIRDGVAKRWFTTHPFHGGAFSPLAGWERDLEAPFMIGITDDDIGHTGGTLMGVEFEATPPRVRSGPTARGARDPMFKWVYGFRPSLLEGGNPPVTEDVRYTVKAGDTLAGIAAANNTTVTNLVNWNPQLLEVGDVLVVQKGVVEVPTVPQFPGTVKLASVGPGGDVAGNKIIQSCLNYLYPPVVIDGIYGNQTKAAYTKWQVACGWSVADGSADGLPGKDSMTKLAAKFGFTLDTTAPPAPTVGAEPAHNYTRRTWSGKTVNQRTYDMLKQAEALSGMTINLSQGSYNTGVSASAGTHDGGGVVDIASSSSALCQALRKVGFAAWVRTPAQGFAYHIHACAIGDREMASGAKSQVQSYFNGRNGLAGNGADTNPPRPYPAWAAKYDM